MNEKWPNSNNNTLNDKNGSSEFKQMAQMYAKGYSFLKNEFKLTELCEK